MGFDLSSLLGKANPYISDLLTAVKQATIEAVLKQHVKLIFAPFTADNVAYMIKAYLNLLEFVPPDLLRQWGDEIRGYEDSVQGTAGEVILGLIWEVRPDIAQVIDTLPQGKEWFSWQVDKLKETLLHKSP